jgi:hypothetical protein
MMGLDWDDETEEDNEWGLYYVAAYNFMGDPLESAWPILAQGYEEAMDIYQILLKLSK